MYNLIPGVIKERDTAATWLLLLPPSSPPQGKLAIPSAHLIFHHSSHPD